MKVGYDPRYNIAYIALQTGETEVETISLSDLVNVDLAPDGSVFGIELMNANEQLGLNGDAEVLFQNEANGRTSAATFTA
ncbi:MAG: DUF2283 domain-containing protein [Hyphomicrobiales bacterium]